MLADRSARPVAVQAYPGNTAGPTTVRDGIETLSRPLRPAGLVGETLADLGHLGGVGVRVGGVQQAEDELLLGGLAVAAVAEGGQRAAAALQVGRADVVQ